MDFGAVAPAVDRPLFDPDEIRAEALAMIARARLTDPAEEWDPDKLRYNRILFPHLVSWLPDESERAQLCFTFAEALDRIEERLAA